MSTDFYGRTWHAADTFLHKGRNPDSYRKFKKTRMVHRLPNGDIAVRLHNTDIVTYHKDTDGWQTIYMGGWDTVTTKGDIGEFSNIRLSKAKLPKDVRELAEERTRKVWPTAYSDLELHLHEPNAPTSPPRIWKCRTCHGEGFIRYNCDGRTVQYCRDGRTITMLVNQEDGTVASEQEVPYTERWNGVWERLDHDDNEPTMNQWCVHRRNNYHPVVTPGCHHGYMEQHIDWHHCWRCNGEGRADYGSKRVPVLVSENIPFLVDGQGRVLAQGRKAIHSALTMSVTIDAKRRIHRTLRAIERRREVA